MGGWMDYERMRKRNGLGNKDTGYEGGMVIGDMNRMERDYLQPETSWLWQQRLDAIASGYDLTDGSPAAVCAAETGIDVETVRKVLRHVFAVPASPKEQT